MLNFAHLTEILTSLYLVAFIVFMAIGGWLVLVSFGQLFRASNVGFKSGYGISPIRIINTFLVGIMFIFFPTTMGLLDVTMLDEQSCNALEAYANPENSCINGGGTNEFYTALNMLFKVFGVFAMARGVYMLRKLGFDQTTGKDEISIWNALGFIVFGWFTFQWQKTVEWFGMIFPVISIVSENIQRMSNNNGIIM